MLEDHSDFPEEKKWKWAGMRAENQETLVVLRREDASLAQLKFRCKSSG